MRQAKQIVTDMMIGLGIWGVLVLLVLEVISRNRLAMAAGVILGLAAAAGLLRHMYRHLDIALDMESGQAQRHTQLAALQRLGIMTAVLILAMTQYRYVHPIGTVLGLFGMKISAFMQPTIHRLRFQEKNG